MCSNDSPERPFIAFLALISSDIGTLASSRLALIDLLRHAAESIEPFLSLHGSECRSFVACCPFRTGGALSSIHVPSCYAGQWGRWQSVMPPSLRIRHHPLYDRHLPRSYGGITDRHLLTHQRLQDRAPSRDVFTVSHFAHVVTPVTLLYFPASLL